MLSVRFGPLGFSDISPHGFPKHPYAPREQQRWGSCQRGGFQPTEKFQLQKNRRLSLFIGGNELRAPLRNPRKRFSEPKAACARGYGGMPEVDLGDPARPRPVQPAKLTAGARQKRRGGRQAAPKAWLYLCARVKTGRQSEARGCGVASLAARRAESQLEGLHPATCFHL